MVMVNTKPMGFLCEDILLIPDFREAVVLAGLNGMRRPISRVNVMEVPDVIDWVRPGELLVTSGFPFRDQPEVLADIIPQLVEKGVAALGIKTKRFINQIPERVLEIADQLDFPIIELPPATAFSDVVREIMERVLVQEARDLSLLQSRFQKLSHQLLHGDSIEGLLENLDSMLNNPIILLDDADHVILSPMAKEIAELTGDLMEWSRLRDDIKLGTSVITVGERRIRVYISAVDSKQYNDCLIMLLEWNQEHSVVDELTIDRVGVLVGLEMINTNARKEVESKYVNQFLQDWISGRIITMEDLQIRADACGCPLDEKRHYCVGVVRWINGKQTAKQMQQVVKRWRMKSIHKDQKSYCSLLEGQLVFLMSLPTPQKLNDAVDSILSELKTLFNSGEEYSICLGKQVDSPDQVVESYHQAKKVHHISTICDLKDVCIDYKKLGVFQLLYFLPDCDEVVQFRDRYIIPLLEYDAKHSTQLMETLQVYLKHNKKIKKSSTDLFTHYNTVIYRIERICEILGIDPENGDDMLQLHLAVKLHEMRPVEY